MAFADSIRHPLSRASDLTRRAAFLGPLLARLTVGLAFVESGWGKVHNLEKVTEYFTELGIPAAGFQAVFVSYVELICGSLVLVGLLTRFAAVPLIGTMVVALITAKASEISGVSDLIGTIELTYAVLLAGLVLTGPGKASLDRLILSRVSPDSTGDAMARPTSLA
jgi:putative oxidoreductase